MEQLPEPTYNFPWKYDNEHYLTINSDYGQIEMRQSNTELYLFPDCPQADHIFVFKEFVDEQLMGYRIFREHVDKIGEGAFGALIDQLVEHGFDIADDETPSESDIEAYESLFNKKLEYKDKTEELVLNALRNIDAEWEWFDKDPDYFRRKR
jgi:hypothetical protein